MSELLKPGVCEEPALSGIEEDCLFLNRFYIDTNWPVNYTGEVVSAAKNAASNISRMVRKLLGENRG